MNKVFSLIPGVVFFLYFVLTLDEMKASSIFGILAISIALGAVSYFHFNAPEGKSETKTAFGITSKYRKPVYGTIIPSNILIGILGSIFVSCILGLGFYHFGN